MPRKPDWMDLAHALDKEREAIQDRLPPGVECFLTLASYGFGGANYSVSLTHRETKLGGYGQGRTPEKALEAAKVNMQEELQKRARRPQLVAAPKTLEAD